MHYDSRSRTLLLSRASGVDLQHLRYAVAAAEHGSFRRAAEALPVRQSTLSRCIRQLEERIQMIVFERSSGGVRATLAGREFLRAARSILEQTDMLVTTEPAAAKPAGSQSVSTLRFRMERILRRAGWPLRRIGKPHPIGNTLAVAGYLEISTESLARARGA